MKIKGTKNFYEIGRKLTGIAVILLLLAGIPVSVIAMTNSGDVSGIVAYTGSISGMHMINIGVHTGLHNPPSAGETSVASPGGAYSVVSVADGTYYVSAYLDVDGSGGEPGDDEPSGWYDANDDGTPDTITVSGGNLTGVDITFGDIAHAPEITLLDGQWNQLGDAVTAISSVGIDLAFYSDAEHNTPAVLYSHSSTGLTLMKWNGGSGLWQSVGPPNFAPQGTSYIALDINDSDVPYAAYSRYPNNYEANVMRFNATNWVTVGSINFSPSSAYRIDMQLKDDGVTPVVAFRDSANSYAGSVMELGAPDWVGVGTPGFTTGGIDTIELALDSSDTPLIAYQGDSMGDNRVGVMKYTGPVDDWQYVGTSTSFPYGSSDPSIAIDSNDTIYVAYNSSADEITVLKHSGSYIQAWETVGTASFASCSSQQLSIALDATDTPYVAFQNDCDGGATVMKYSGTGTSGWEIVGTAGFSNGSTRNIVIKFNNDNTPYVAYLDNSGTYPDWPTYVMQFDEYPAISETAVTMSEDSIPTPFDLSLRGFDENGDALTWSIAAQGTHGIAAIASTLGTTGTVTATLAYTPTANFNGVDSFVVQLDDGTETVTATVNITIDPTNDAPTANFADQTVAQGETVMLDGTLSSDIEGEPLDFHWTQTGGTAVTFTDNISQPTFTAPAAPATLTFSLTVTDTGGLSDAHAGTVWVVGGDASTTVLTDTETVFAPPAAPFTITVPAGGVGQPISLVFTDTVSGYSPPAEMQFLGDTFSLAAYIDGVLQPGFTFDPPFTITLTYSDDEISGFDESTLTLLYWDGSVWASDGIVLVSRDPVNNQVTFTVSHITDFAFVAEESYLIYLPLVLK